MSRIEIPISGISTQTTYTEGDCTELINLRKKNGAMHPVSPRKIIREFSNSYTLLFVHRNESYEHLIGVRDGNLYWITRENLTDTETLIMPVAGVNSITQTGNMLNVLCADGIKYALWSEEKYLLISANISADVEIYTDIKKRDGEPETFQFYADSISTTDDTLRIETAKGLFEKQKRLLNDKGLLTGMTIAMTAIEMFDGNIIYTSNPVILMQSNDIYKRYSNLTVVEKDTNANFVFNFENNPAIFNVKNTDLTPSSGNHFLQDEEALIGQYASYTGLEFQAGIPGCTTTGTNVESIPLVMITNESGTTSIPRVIATGNELYVKINNQLDASLRNFIKSISVYITPEVSIYDYKDIARTLRGNIYLHENYTYNAVNTCPKLKSYKEINDELLSQVNFYKVHEINFDEINANAGQTILIDLKGKLGDNLYTREALPVTASMHTLKASHQIVYNSRLHLMNYSSDLFEGYPLSNFHLLPGTGHFPVVNSWENFNWWIEVTIKLTTGIAKVVTSKFNTPITDLNPMLSYPDARATSIKLYISGTTTEEGLGGQTITVYHKYEKEFILKAHKYHNYAYHLAPDLKPIPINVAVASIAYTPPVLNQVNATETYPNGIKVSATNNPLYFPPEHSYQAGSGAILNAATNAMNVSDRNFGQYPLFVATTQGWFMMNVGTGEAAYTSIIPVTSGEVPQNNLLCSTPYGVIFIGKRGLYLINGNGADLITPQTEETMPAINIQGYDAIMLQDGNDNEIYDNVADSGFRDFLTRIKTMLYDASENELILVSTTEGEMNWVLSFDSKTLYRSTEPIDYEIENTYPHLYVIDGKNQKDYSQAETADAEVLFMLRPVACGTRDIKKLDRAWLRGLLRGLKNKNTSIKPVIVLWHSDDNVNFTTTRGMTINPGNYRDYDMGLLARTKKRWFAFGFRGIVHADSTINSIELQLNKEYSNEKMR